MDFRAGLILVCMLFARASCQPVRNKTTDGALTSSIKTIVEEIQKALQELSSDPGLLPNIPCSTLKMMKQLEQQPLSVQNISALSCYMQKFSDVIPQVSQELNTTVQFMQNMEPLLTDQVVPESCDLPAFEERLDILIHAKCFLQLVQKRLSDSKL